MTTLFRYRFGNVVLDESKAELIVGGLPVDVQPKPLQLLSLLLTQAGEVVTRDDIFNKIWQGRRTVDNVLANAITKLRNALGDQNAACIQNVPRLGYRFVGPLERTAVGKVLSSGMSFVAGNSVPMRVGFVFERLLSRTDGQEVWVAQDQHSGERRVYKYAADSARMVALKREVTIDRLLRDQLGERPDMVSFLGWNFDQAPYFVESIYGGEDLLTWSEVDSRLVAMSPTDRIGLMLQIGNAVAAAHGAGVLHKDLNSKNVLVAADGAHWQIRLADFGSGHLLDADQLHRLGITSFGVSPGDKEADESTRGTLLYMAPELLLGQPATVRSDIFALGMLCYQLAVGDLRRPLGAGWELDLSDELLREDIARACARAPDARFGSAEDFMTGLRLLDTRRADRNARLEEQRQAQANREAVRRARVRRPWVVATIISLAIGFMISVSLYVKVRVAREAQARDFAAASTLNLFLTQDFIALADPSYAGRRDVSVVEAARAAAGRIDSRFSAVAPEIRAGLHASMQQSLHGLGDYEAAIGEGLKALQAFSVASGNDPREAEVRIALAYDYIELSRLQESAAQLEGAAALIKAQHLDNTAVAVRYLYVHASADADRLDLPKALQGYLRAWELSESVPNVDANLRDSIEFSLADLLNLSGDSAQAETHIKHLLAQQTQRLGPSHPKTCHTAVVEARIYSYQRRFEEALPIAAAAEACLSQALGPTHARTLSAKEVIADLYYQSEDYAKAAVAYHQLAQAYQQQLGPLASRTLNIRVNVGVSLLYSGQTAAAQTELAGALDEASAALEWTNPIVEHLRFHLADCRLDLNHTNGVAHLLAGLSVQTLNEGEIESDWGGRLAYEAGRLLLETGDPAAALPKLESAASIFAANHSKGHITESQILSLIEKERQKGRHSSTFALTSRRFSPDLGSVCCA